MDLEGDCASSNGHVCEPHPGEVDCSYVLYEYILQSIHILYEHTLYCIYSTLDGYIQRNAKRD